MKVLLLGATGKLGSRCIPALLAHKHQVVVFIRSESKLKDLLPPSLLADIAIVLGDAADAKAISKALIDGQCDALINSAGQANIFPWQAPRMQRIVEAVACACLDASLQLGHPMRAWFMGGMTALDMPGMPGTKIVQYFPMFTEHSLTHVCLSSKLSGNLQWSLLCVSALYPLEEKISKLEAPRPRDIVASVDIPPNWVSSYLNSIPLLGPLLSVLGNTTRYNIKLEDCADLMASDLAESHSKFIGHRVGLIEASKGKSE